MNLSKAGLKFKDQQDLAITVRVDEFVCRGVMGERGIGTCGPEGTHGQGG